MKRTCRMVALGVLVLATSTGAFSDEIVIEHGETRVTQSDLRRSIEQMIPARQLGAFYADRRRLSQHAGNFFTVRKLAEMAEARGLSEEEQWRVEEARARALSQAQLDYMVSQAPQPDFEKLALETYRAYPERFHSEEAVRVEHILIATKDRGEEEAKKQALEVYELANSGRVFAELAAEYSEDPASARNAGDLGFFTRDQMVKPFEEAAFRLTEPGQIAGPVQTPFGFHIIKFVDRRPAGLRPFEEVKDSIIATERDAFRTRAVNEIIGQIAGLEGVKTNYDALMSLHNPIELGGRRARGQQ